MARPLKIFRTAIGFHDAYVAAPTQKAALEAWGSSHNLFARGAAEQVTDPALTAEPLAHPGTVIKRLRGTTDEQLAALPANAPKSARATRARTPRPAPRPDRAALDAAEQARDAARDAHASALAALDKRQAALDRERRALERSGTQRIAACEADLERIERAYRSALAKWRG